MKVYLVMYIYYDESEIRGVFSTRDKAQSFIDNDKVFDKSDQDITELTVDDQIN